jgi:hypothetical protein
MKSEMYGRWIQDMYGAIYCHPGVVGGGKVMKTYHCQSIRMTPVMR